MKGYLLDTSFVIAYFNELATRKLGPARSYRATLPGHSRLYVSTVTLEEVLEGAADERAVERELRLLAGFVSLGAETARRCARNQRAAKTQGRRMGENDAWIAATAELADLPLIGHDAAFKERPRLRYLDFQNALDPTS